jgi:putative acetyltransferase
MTPTVRDATPADTPAIAGLCRDTVRRVNRKDYSREQVEAWAPDSLDENHWADRLRPLAVLVAEAGGRVVGFASWRPADGYLDHLYVHADHQGEGVASALLARVEDAARAAGSTRLHSEASVTARPFFERRGFAVVAEQTVVRRGVAFSNYRTEKAL